MARNEIPLNYVHLTIITPRAYALAGLSDCFCPSVSQSVSLSVNNIEIPFKVVTMNFVNDIKTVEMAQSYHLCAWQKSKRLLFCRDFQRLFFPGFTLHALRPTLY